MESDLWGASWHSHSLLNVSLQTSFNAARSCLCYLSRPFRASVASVSNLYHLEGEAFRRPERSISATLGIYSSPSTDTCKTWTQRTTSKATTLKTILELEHPEFFISIRPTNIPTPVIALYYAN